VAGRRSTWVGSALRVTALPALVLVTVLLPPAAATASARSSVSPAGCSWSVAAANVHAASGTLESVDALSADDAWAVGSLQTPRRALPLAEHWDGRRWTPVSTPTAGRYVRVLHGVLAVAPDDVWAVGSQIVVKTGTVQTLIEHWDGTLWSVVPGPRPRSDHEELLAVAGRSASSLWAVGYSEPGLSPLPLVLHWDGAKWLVAPAPTGGTLQGVAARSASGIWAVGTSAPGVSRALLAVRNRSGWSVDEAAPPQDLSAIAWRRPFDAWAVGYTPAAAPANQKPLALHWDGSTWSTAPTPTLRQSAELRGVAAISPNEAWAVGTRNFTHPLLLRWNGTAWRVAAAPAVGTSLEDVTRVPASRRLWAVGSGAPGPLVMRYC